MLSITSSQPVHWPPSPSPSVAPVTPVGAVAPAQSQARDQASGFNSGQEGRAGTAPDTAQDRRVIADKAVPESSAAPLLPREQPEGGQQGETASSVGSGKATDKTREAQAKAEEKATEQPPLQDVLSSVWKASAAVVDVILGREAASAKATTGVDLGKAESPDRASALPVASGDAGASGFVPPWQPAQAEPVTYTDQGASVWGSIETGTRLNQKA